VTPKELLAQLDAETAAATKPTQRGDALARFIEQIMCQLDGVSLHETKVFSDDRSQELDVILWNERLPGLTGLSFFPFIVFVEAKNWDERVGSSEVAWFKEKVRLSGDYAGTGAIGILVASNGVTGDRDDRDFAVAVIRAARAERVFIIVARPADLAVEPPDLREFLRRRVCDLAGGRVGLP
jgi:hypothetical protein